MAIAAIIESLLSHPAPGLHFPAHEAAGVDEYILPAPHRVRMGAGWLARYMLRRMTREAPAVQKVLLEFYQRWNGIDLCSLVDPINEGHYSPGLSILPIGGWAGATKELATGRRSWMFEDLRDMYEPGNFIALGGHNSEGTNFVIFTKGRLEGQPLAGKIFCVSMDPVLSYTEPVAASFESFLADFAKDPVAFLKKVGFCHCVSNGRGGMWGAVPDRYIPDIRGMKVLSRPPGF